MPYKTYVRKVVDTVRAMQYTKENMSDIIEMYFRNEPVSIDSNLTITRKSYDGVETSYDAILLGQWIVVASYGPPTIVSNATFQSTFMEKESQ